MINFITNKIKYWILAILGIGVCFAAPIGVDIDNKANPYEKIGTQFEIQLPEQARIAVSENKPELYLGKWDDECFIKVGLPTQSNNKVKRKLFTNKLEWQDGNNKIHMYPIEDGFEYEVIFDEKPISNIVKLEIETQGLKYYYQPPLYLENGLIEPTEDCSATDCDNSHRPENVVGSYAVYHESKQGDYSQLGLKNYRAGKAFHIYRPRIIDSAGKEVWGELNITDNLLTVEIPQEFLDNAIYPVRHAAGLTFGYTGTIYASTRDLYDMIAGSKFTGASGTAEKINAYVYADGTFSHSMKAAIYQHSNSSKIAETTETTNGPSGWSWVEFTFSGSPSISAIDYVLVCTAQTNSGWLYLNGDTGATDQGHYQSRDYDLGFPATASFSHNTNKYSIYCTYTAGGGAARRIIITE